MQSYFKGAALRSGKVVNRPIDAGLETALNDSAKAIGDSTTALAKSIGLSGDISGAGSVEFGFAWNAGALDQAKLQEAMANSLETLSDSLARAVLDVEKYALAGEKSFEVLNRLATSLNAVNPVLDTLGLKLLDVSVQGAIAASEFVQVFGSLEAMNAATASYYQNFYSEQERVTKATENMTAALASLGLVMPSTLEGFRNLVEQARAMGDMQQMGQLIGLSSAFSAIIQGQKALVETAHPLSETSS
jgi:hypothetical protein